MQSLLNIKPTQENEKFSNRHPAPSQQQTDTQLTLTHTQQAKREDNNP